MELSRLVLVFLDNSPSPSSLPPRFLQQTNHRQLRGSRAQAKTPLSLDLNWSSVSLPRVTTRSAPLKSFCPTCPSTYFDKHHNLNTIVTVCPRAPPTTPHQVNFSPKTAIMAGVSDKARYYLERAAPELREFEDKEIFSKVRSLPIPQSHPNPQLTAHPSPGRNPIPRHPPLRPRTHDPRPGRPSLRLPRLRRLGTLPRPPAHQTLRPPSHPAIHLARQPRPHLFHL